MQIKRIKFLNQNMAKKDFDLGSCEAKSSLIDSALAKTARLLPNIRPLKAFLHLNMFPDLLDCKFWEAIEITREAYNWNPLYSIDAYKNLYSAGEISQIQLQKVLQNHGWGEDDFAREIGREGKLVSVSEKSYRPLHKIINRQLRTSLNELSEPILIRFLSAYFDQGISKSELPLTNSGLYECFKHLCTESLIPFYPIKKNLFSEPWARSPESAIDHISTYLIQDENLIEKYIEECLLSLKGWSGFVKTIEKHPHLLVKKRNSSLIELLAIRLILEYCWVRLLAPDYCAITDAKYLQETSDNPPGVTSRDFEILKIWQTAYERSYLEKIVPQYTNFITKPSKQRKPKFQAFFCIDDRECFLRYALEKTDPDCETFGTPGHFGLDFSFQDGEAGHPIKHCPDPVTAKFTLIKKSPAIVSKKFRWMQDKNLFIDYLDIFTEGIFTLVEAFKHTVLHSERKESPVEYLPPLAVNPFKNGYSFEEAADRVSVVLQSTGLLKEFSNYIFIIGHTSTSTNNPYFTAYGCGACSGQNGGVNANIFCNMVNDLNVRLILKDKHGLKIPERTTFLPAVHDTCREVVTFYIEDHLRFASDFHDFSNIITKALEIVAQRRVQDFEFAPKDDPHQALKHLESRSRSIFEPRPELGHTNNALCIIGKRLQGFTFDRRAFLQSYDSTRDPDGQILESILMATVPVCGGISLDYFFSKINPNIGAGSKLSHNITSLVGVSHGTEDDLLTGLAQQMIELHQPMRIAFIIEQDCSILNEIIKRNSVLSLWIKNEWIQLIVHQKSGSVFYFEGGMFKDFHEVIPC